MMPFSLINTLATFQAYINKALFKLVDYFVVIYLDDILIYFKLKEDYYTHIKIVIKTLRKYKLYIKFNKYFFDVEEVKFLKFIVNIIRMKLNSNRIFIIEK